MCGGSRGVKKGRRRRRERLRPPPLPSRMGFPPSTGGSRCAARRPCPRRAGCCRWPRRSASAHSAPSRPAACHAAHGTTPSCCCGRASAHGWSRPSSRHSRPYGGPSRAAARRRPAASAAEAARRRDPPRARRLVGRPNRAGCPQPAHQTAPTAGRVPVAGLHQQRQASREPRP
eukprot:1283222-Prymnesium_polylepis.1